jgi:hypothetical protein
VGEVRGGGEPGGGRCWGEGSSEGDALGVARLTNGVISYKWKS